MEIKDGDTVMSLGLKWILHQDQYLFNIAMNSTRLKCSKWTFLSYFNRVFDPLGFSAIVLLKRKIFLQQISPERLIDSSFSVNIIEKEMGKVYTRVEHIQEATLYNNPGSHKKNATAS